VIAGAIGAGAEPGAGAGAPGAHARAQVATEPALAALIDAAGIARHLEEWPEANTLARELAQTSLAPDAFALLMREVASALAPTALRERVTARLAARVPAPIAASLREGWSQSGSVGLLGPADGLSAADLRELPRFASAVSRRQLDPARLALVARLDAATGFGRNAWRVTGAWGVAVERGARALRCDGSAAWQAPLSPEQSAERRHLVEPFRGRVHLELLFLVRTHSSPDLQRSVGFLETQPVRDFHAAVADAVSAALADALADLRTRLAGPVAARCANRG
jgi:hypothetical protein